MAITAFESATVYDRVYNQTNNERVVILGNLCVGGGWGRRQLFLWHRTSYIPPCVILAGVPCCMAQECCRLSGGLISSCLSWCIIAVIA